MALVRNDAKDMGNEDSTLKVNTDSYLLDCINIANSPWKDSKNLIDNMSLEELEKFTAATSILDLAKSGSMTLRLNIRDYATLKLIALVHNTTVTTVIEKAVKRLKEEM